MNAKLQTAMLSIRLGKPIDGDFRATSSDKTDPKTNCPRVYSYRFLGGRKGRGHLSSIVGHPEDYLVEIRTKGYVFKDIEFFGTNVKSQMSHSVDKAKRTVTITNSAQQVMQGYYHVFVVRESTGETIDCDPMISNEPRG